MTQVNTYMSKNRNAYAPGFVIRVAIYQACKGGQNNKVPAPAYMGQTK